jgi:ankyrin repeat protein/mono/diheme cytochrome c family protein
MRSLWALFVLLGLPWAASAQTQLPPAASTKVDYDVDVRPILAQNCYSCHGPEAQQSGLRLDLRQNALRGGDYGPVIIPGDSAASKLIRRLVDGDGGVQMPPTGPLSSDEIGILRAWIDQGPEFRTAIAPEAPPRPIDPKLAAVIAAVRSGDRGALEKLIASDPDVLSAKDPAGSTPLHHAAGFGTLESLTLLLERGADIHAKNRRASTPLHWAVHDEAKVRLLLSRGAAVNARQVEGRTPVYQAAVLGGGLPVLRLLLESGGNPGTPILNGQTPLAVAAIRGDTEAMRVLIEKGADVNARSGAGNTALMAAATNGSAGAVQLLLEKGADATATSKLGESALGNAAMAGNLESVKMLLARGADVNSRNSRGYSPLLLAAGSDSMHAGIVRTLLAGGADTTFSADYDETALMLAAKRGDTEVTRVLGGLAKLGIGQGTAASRHNNPASLSKAIENAMALLEKQSHNFIRIGGCNSCHSQDLPSAAAAIARDRGIAAPREIPQLPSSMTLSPERVTDLNAVSVASIAWELFDLGTNHTPKNGFTDAVVRYIKAMQTPEGNWTTNEGRRPPMSSGDFQAAALAIYSLKAYGPDLEKATTDMVVAKAVGWLERARPTTSQDRAFHLLGLAWGNGAPLVIKAAARDLARMQRSDGGWNQLPEMDSDAYATGQSLYALNVAGKMAVTNSVYQKGVDYLLRTQAPDGSWHVRTRAIWVQPYFESGFPYGRDQFISTAGTAWAAIALASAAEPQRVTEKR